MYLLSENEVTSVNKTKVAFRGNFAGLSKGTVQVFMNGQLIATVKADKNGKWRIRIHPKRNTVNAYQFKYFDSGGQLVETTPSYQFMVDQLKPIIELQKKINSPRGGTINWQVTDNDAVSHCTCSFRGKDYSISGNSFTVPETTPQGNSMLKVTCFDRAKNSASIRAEISVE